jgi:hypothetical protein
MPVQDVIPPYEQMYLLNQQLICNADQFKHAVITVGGQAVQYWISYYHAQYGDRLPDERLTTSVDCDYSARKDDIAAIAKTLNVKTWENKDGQPPSRTVYAYRSGHTISNGMMDAYLPYRMRLTSQMWWILSTDPEALTVLIFWGKALPVYRPVLCRSNRPRYA